MIYELNDISKVERLFDGMEDSVLRACLQQTMGGTVYVTDPESPVSAMAYLAEDVFFAGEPDRELAAFKPAGVVMMVPPDARWAELIEEEWPDADKATRYAIKKDTKFDREKLEKLAAALPSGYAFRRIDSELYDILLEEDLFEDCVLHFGSKEQYLSLGRGFVVMKDGQPVSAASSYTVFREGIEIEIDTAEAERRKGLASAVGAKLILSCLDDGLYPSWDAANLESVHLAEKLGYTFDREYISYWLDEILDIAVKDPDKSKWEDFCGKYEYPADKKTLLFEIRLDDGDLYWKFTNSEGKEYDLKLFPVGENEFGACWSDDRLVFEDGRLLCNDRSCKKL